MGRRARRRRARKALRARGRAAGRTAGQRQRPSLFAILIVAILLVFFLIRRVSAEAIVGWLA